MLFEVLVYKEMAHPRKNSTEISLVLTEK